MTTPKPFIGRPSKYDLKAIADDLVQWSQNPDSLKFTMFAAPRMINLQRFPEWEKRDEYFAEAYAIARQNLDINRFKAAATQIMPDYWYSKNERIYDSIHDNHYRDEKKFESSLKKDEEGSKQSTYTIVVPHDLCAGADIPTSPVPKKDHPGAQ